MIPAMPRDDCLEALRKMLLIRRFEEACILAAQKAQVPGHFHEDVNRHPVIHTWSYRLAEAA